MFAVHSVMLYVHLFLHLTSRVFPCTMGPFFQEQRQILISIAFVMHWDYEWLIDWLYLGGRSLTTQLVSDTAELEVTRYTCKCLLLKRQITQIWTIAGYFKAGTLRVLNIPSRRSGMSEATPCDLCTLLSSTSKKKNMQSSWRIQHSRSKSLSLQTVKENIATSTVGSVSVL